MPITVEHYTCERIPNPNPQGVTPEAAFEKVRQVIVTVCRKYGVTGPDDNPFDCDVYVIEDQYNDELYQYVEVYSRSLLSPAWIRDLMAALRTVPGWGIGVKNIRFAHLLIFADKLMVTGYPFAGCHNLESVAAAASANLWGVNGEPVPYTCDSLHRDELLAASVCGCYYCCAMYSPSELFEWTDEDDDGLGQTAVCPCCGNCKVIAPQPSFSLEPEALRRLSEMAFGPSAGRSPQ